MKIGQRDPVQLDLWLCRPDRSCVRIPARRKKEVHLKVRDRSVTAPVFCQS